MNPHQPSMGEQFLDLRFGGTLFQPVVDVWVEVDPAVSAYDGA